MYLMSVTLNKGADELYGLNSILNNRLGASETLHYVLRAPLFVKVERFPLKQTNSTTERVQERARSGMGPAARQNEHLPLLIGEIGANDEAQV